MSPCKCGPGGFTQLSGAIVNQTLIRTLTNCVDSVRDIYTCLGARAYEVVLVRTRWSGGKRGHGTEEVIDEAVVLPTPFVSDFKAVRTQQQPVGSEEEGTVTVSEISPRFTADALQGIGDDGSPIPKDENFYWEIRGIRADGMAQRKRFLPNSVPNYSPTKFQWTIELVKAYEDRTRRGDVRG